MLITGASGFVGSAVARLLLARGFRVKALVRGDKDRINLRDLDVEIASGDLSDAAAVARAIGGARFVFHVAADYRLWAPDRRKIMTNNVSYTETVMNAVLAEGAERVVYTSSVATLKPDRERPADETRPASLANAVGVYKQSKVAAERQVEHMVRTRGLPAVIVNPSTPIGPRDIRPTPTGRIVIEAASGRMPAYVDSGLNLAHVDDIAAGHLAALDRGRIGERYILGGQDVRLRDVLAAIAHRAGRKAPRVRLPRWPLFPIAWLNEQRCRLTGGDPFLNVDSLKMARDAMYFSSSKAENELGYHARPYEEGIDDALAWFRQQRMIP